MKKIRWIKLKGIAAICVGIFLGCALPLLAAPVKVACVGDSITVGVGTKNPTLESYPAQLGRLLGEDWEVRNFGNSGSTLLKSGNKPYQQQDSFRQAKDFQPDVVVIMLGSNDTKPKNWRFKDQFPADYLDLIAQFQALASHPRIHLCLPPFVPGEGNFGINEQAVKEQIPLIREIAIKGHLQVIDTHAATARPELFPDRVHPNLEGATVLATTVYEALAGKDSLRGEATKLSEWKGFVRSDFQLDGRKCIVVSPKSAAPGKPWIWRAYFFGHEPQTDIALLEKGFHLAYMDVVDLYGCPEAVAHWNVFYEYLTGSQGFSRRVALEGMSRGGLIVYNWAKANPEKVACIYADAPVCDIRSWPGGKGVSRGDTNCWEICKKAYGLTEETAADFQGNPLDGLEALAQAHVPLLHVCGAADDVVPMAENTDLLQERYERLGGSIQVISKPGVGHHPHSLKDPSAIVDFILEHTAPLAATPPATDLRQTLNFNREWKFQLGDPASASAVPFDDQKWDDIGLPHSFSMPYFAAEKFYVGYGWYRKHFQATKKWAGKRIHLEFDGVFQVAEIFVNGQRVGEHEGGYTGFTFDITDTVKAGDNVVAIRVNNLWNARLAPRVGEHVFSGGIYRNVRLVVTSPLHVAWYGTCVTTPQVAKESGTVNVKTEVVNDSHQEKPATVQTRVLDADGKLVAEMKSTQKVAARATAVFDQTSGDIKNPRLWSPASPNLYSVKTTVLDGEQPADDYTSPLGFRWFKFTVDQGFFLNGEHYYFKGANVHQDHAGWGDAVADSGFFRDVSLVKNAGMDFIRGSHYPHAPAFTAACDQLGMLFWSENSFWGMGGFKGDGYWNASAYPTNVMDEAEFKASVKASLRDMVRIHRNHPSVIVWSMSNEPFFSAKEVMPKVQTFLRDLVAYAHELDPTRPAAIGGCQRGDIDKLGDVAGYNGDGARLFVNPGVASVVSEYGSTIADRPGKYEAGWGDLTSTPGADKSKIGSWRLPWRSGEAIWCAFDHGSIAGRNFGAMGMVDYFRLPKRMWYWYRNEYQHIPPPEWPGNGIPAGLKLTADKTILTGVDGTEDAQIIVTVVDREGKAISNCPPVTLAIESGPGEFPTGPAIAFAPDSDITIRDGQAAMEFRSYYAGKTVIRATSPGLKDATVEITSLGEPHFIAGKTAPVKARPYVRFTGTIATNALVRLGLENPTRVSSETAGHNGSMANDGNPATYWQADAGDRHAWLSVDLEKIVTVSKTKLHFPSAGNWRYLIEISQSGTGDWKLISDQTGYSGSEPERTEVAAAKESGRFLRIRFTGVPPGKAAALTEVEVIGNLAEK